MKTIIYNADIANEGRLTRGYIVIDDEIIAEVGEGEPAAAVMAECDVRNDVDGALVMPGVIDDQVHFRDPGLTHKADIATESAAAVAGGVTSYMDMPNTVPPTVTIDALEAKNRRAQEVSVANYGFFIGATNDNLKTLMAVDYSYTPGVKLFLGASTGNMLVSDRDALHDIFAEVPALVAIHSEDEQLIRRNREFYIKKYGDDLPVKFHPLIRSTEVCYKSTHVPWNGLRSTAQGYTCYTCRQLASWNCSTTVRFWKRKSPPRCASTICGLPTTTILASETL